MTDHSRLARIAIIVVGAMLTISAAIPSQAAEANESNRWISDRLTVPLRSGPTNGHRILHRGLPAGTQLTILEQDADSDYVRIRTQRGTEGWLEAQYLDKRPIARQRLSAAQNEAERLRAQLTKRQSELVNLRQSKGSAEANSSQLQTQVESLSAELEALQAISKNAVAEHAENRKLVDLNERLRNEVEDLAAERDTLRSNAQQRWLIVGGGLVLIGLLLGVLIKARPRQSAWT
ncbi:MAG: TIGR04211 family SH3 domain-containing protein [Pseudomonadales bacterium]